MQRMEIGGGWKNSGENLMIYEMMTANQPPFGDSLCKSNPRRQLWRSRQ